MKQESINKHIGKVISAKRKKKNMPQTVLAEALGVTRSTVSRYETGDIDIPLSKLPAICDKCNFPPRDYISNIQSDDVINRVVKNVFPADDSTTKDLSTDFIEYISDSRNRNDLNKMCDAYEALFILDRFDVEQNILERIEVEVISESFNNVKDSKLKQRLCAYYNLFKQNKKT